MSAFAPMPLPMTDALLSPSEHNLIWIDLEMTGLDASSDRIIELAVIVTDPQVAIRVEGPVIAVHQPDSVLDAMDAWNKGTHGKSGLIDRVRASRIDEAQAEAEVIDFLRRYVPAGKSPMCGNSICQDRRFLYRLMPRLERYFHYRNLDVSTIKELARRWAPEVAHGFIKDSAHTALSDVRDSIAELRYYRPFLGRVGALSSVPT